MKKKQVKTLFIVLALVLVSGMLFTACGGGNTGDNNMNNNAANNDTAADDDMPMLSGTVTLWHALKDTETEGLNTIIENFQAIYPDVQFEILFVPFDDLRNKYETAAAIGEGPDLLIGGDDWGPPMFNALLIQDVADVEVSDINAAAMSVGQYKGAQVGLPYVLKGVVLYRNQAIISEPAADFAALKAQAEAATEGDTFGALLEIGNFFSFGHLYGLGGALMTADGDPAFNTPEGVAWLEMLQDFYALGADAWYTDNDINLFKEGKVGYVIDGTWNLGDFSASLGDDLVIDPWPADMSGFVQTGMIYLNANTTGENLDASKAFMAYLLSADAQAAFYAADGAFIPSNTTVEVTDPLRQQALAAFEGGVGWIVIPEMGAYWGPTETAIKSALETDDDLAGLLATAEQAVNDAVAEIRAGE